jgi:hypothetical protein
MLLNTHTWLLKEYAGARLCPENLDILIYNVMPDILPIHRGITPEMTHRIERLGAVPPGHGKARFIQFHLLVDDLSHHGHITRRGHDRFENASEGYAYRKGAALVQNLIELHGGRNDGKITMEEALYRSHLLIEMALDLVVYQRYPEIVELFSQAVEWTLENRLENLVGTLAWSYSLPEALAREAVMQGMAAYRNEILRRSVSLDGRTGLYLHKFYGGVAGKKVRSGIRDLLQMGIESVADSEEFLSATLQEIAKAGFDGGL